MRIDYNLDVNSLLEMSQSNAYLEKGDSVIIMDRETGERVKAKIINIKKDGTYILSRY
ncbi:hypothetical protein [Sporosarcina globispora]|uniref:hypothetical protein n=1 Tax=Sporosarcina globispora TaxID=1459 RepID=UPI000A7A64F6|nr:hypothetical protein [Sporosarcina globispora]